MSLSFYVPNTSSNIIFNGPQAALDDDVISASNGKYLKVNAGATQWVTPNTANNVAVCDSSGLIPSSILPSFVDDVLTYATAANFPATGESGKIYVSMDDSMSYRWDGSSYFNMSRHQFYTKAEVNTGLSFYVLKSGDTMTGNFAAPNVFTGSLCSPDGVAKLTTANSSSIVANANINMNSKDITNIVNISGVNSAAVATFGTYVAQSTVQTPSLQCGNVGAFNGSFNSSGSLYAATASGGIIDFNNGVCSIICPVGFGVTASNFNLADIPAGSGSTLQITGTRVYINTSNVKYKENITDLSIDTSKLYNLQPKKYNFKSQPGNDTIGYLAHEMYAQYPLLCNMKDGEADSIRYDLLCVVLVEELKNMRNTVQQLEARITALGG